MTSKYLRLLTWNVNGLHAHCTDHHSYVLTNLLDIIAHQEVRPRLSALQGYDFHVLDSATGSTRGMATYVRQGTTLVFEEIDITDGIEYIIVSLRYMGEKLFFVNTYVYARALIMSMRSKRFS